MKKPFDRCAVTTPAVVTNWPSNADVAPGALDGGNRQRGGLLDGEPDRRRRRAVQPVGDGGGDDAKSGATWHRRAVREDAIARCRVTVRAVIEERLIGRALDRGQIARDDEGVVFGDAARRDSDHQERGRAGQDRSRRRPAARGGWNAARVVRVGRILEKVGCVVVRVGSAAGPRGWRPFRSGASEPGPAAFETVRRAVADEIDDQACSTGRRHVRAAVPATSATLPADPLMRQVRPMASGGG